jgi:hypothetical protein
MRSISVRRWISSSLISARLARFTCLLDFRDSYGLLDHLNSDGFDCWSNRLFHFRRSFLHRRMTESARTDFEIDANARVVLVTADLSNRGQGLQDCLCSCGPASQCSGGGSGGSFE